MRQYSDDDIETAVKESISYSEAIRKLGLKASGSSFATIKRHIERLSIDITHFKGQAHNHGKELVSFGKLKSHARIKFRLIQQRGRQCEECGLEEWRDAYIPLELHHIDGDNKNNDPDNLQLLCCNCHAITPNYKNNVR